MHSTFSMQILPLYFKFITEKGKFSIEVMSMFGKKVMWSQQRIRERSYKLHWSNTLKLQKCKNTKAYRAKQVLGSSANQCTCNKNGGNKLRMRSLSRPQRYWHLAQQSKNYRRGQHCTHPPGTLGLTLKNWNPKSEAILSTSWPQQTPKV